MHHYILILLVYSTSVHTAQRKLRPRTPDLFDLVGSHGHHTAAQEEMHWSELLQRPDGHITFTTAITSFIDDCLMADDSNRKKLSSQYKALLTAALNDVRCKNAQQQLISIAEALPWLQDDDPALDLGDISFMHGVIPGFIEDALADDDETLSRYVDDWFDDLLEDFPQNNLRELHDFIHEKIVPRLKTGDPVHKKALEIVQKTDRMLC